MRLGWLVVASALVHVAGGMWLGHARGAERKVREHQMVELEVRPRPEPKEAPPAPAPPVAAVAPPAPNAPRPTRPRHVPMHAAEGAPAAPGAAAPTVEVPADAPGDPLDFTASGPIVAASGPEGAGAPGAARGAKAAPGGPRTAPSVPLADLSRPPVPPALDEALREHYPAAARAAGRSGKASVRVRIAADGVARVLSIVDSSDAAFAEACRQTVEHSRWRAPLDAQGAPVATELTYSCAFEVGAL